LGHAAFDYVKEVYGEEGIRLLLFALRREVIAGTADLHQSALGLTPDGFDLAIEQYLTERFR